MLKMFLARVCCSFFQAIDALTLVSTASSASQITYKTQIEHQIYFGLLGKISYKVEPSMRQLHSSHNQLQTVLSRWKSSNRLQTLFLPRRQFCRRGVLCHLDHILLCRFHGLERNTQLYPIAALKLTLFSLGAGLRMDGIPAMNMWDTPQILKHQEPFGDIDYVPPNARLII